ncbi:hypothetical protein [Pseudomonas asplenii]|uniref:hypothetical protein n=1 Tax=Pseudomonas asplenii TaxID=53407 RepID=UPI0006B45C7F|nr:hypothetical protein [Pseudomonas fuscovaginae]KPA94798.1 hypothetical protein PF70_05207 [Pseudomonas fuscovaginae]
MNNLQFCAPRLDAFLELLEPSWSNQGLVVRLIGDNTLARDLAEAAQARGVGLLRELPREDEVAAGAQWIIFTEEDGARLADQLLACVGLSDVSLLAPITDHHFSRRPLFLVSIPKSGTHLLYELARALGYQEGVVLPEFPKPQTWYCVEYSNSHTVAADFFVDSVRRSSFGNRHHAFLSSPALFMYRHPLDILVSEANYYEREGKTTFAGWLSGLDVAGRISRLLDDNWLLGSLRQRIGGFLPWLDFPNVASLSFEELIGAAGGGREADQLRLIWSILLKLQAPGSPVAIAAKLFNRDSATFRSGQIGGFRQAMAAADIARFVEHNQDLLSTLGYPLDGSIDLPANRRVRQASPLRYAIETFDETPILLEGDFFSCNLVRFRRRLYALPLQVGAVDLRACSEAQLAALPSASSIGELKALLLLGRSAVEERQVVLQEVSRLLVGRSAEPEEGPSLVTTYNGFNVFRIQQRFIGLRQAAGPMDLSGSLQTLLKRYPTSDLLIARTLDELAEHIDGLSMVMRGYDTRNEDESDLHGQLQDANRELAYQLERANARIDSMEQMLHHLSQPWWQRLWSRITSKPGGQS